MGIKGSKTKGSKIGRARWILGICAAIGWWGVLYPEFTLVEDTYRIVVYDESTDELRIVEPDAYQGDSVYYEMLEAAPEQIVYKSKLLEEARRLFRKE